MLKGSKLGDRNALFCDIVAGDEAARRLPLDRERFRGRHFEVTAHLGNVMDMFIARARNNIFD